MKSKPDNSAEVEVQMCDHQCLWGKTNERFLNVAVCFYNRFKGGIAEVGAAHVRKQLIEGTTQECSPQEASVGTMKLVRSHPEDRTRRRTRPWRNGCRDGCKSACWDQKIRFRVFHQRRPKLSRTRAATGMEGRRGTEKKMRVPATWWSTS